MRACKHWTDDDWLRVYNQYIQNSYMTVDEVARRNDIYAPTMLSGFRQRGWPLRADLGLDMDARYIIRGDEAEKIALRREQGETMTSIAESYYTTPGVIRRLLRHTGKYKPYPAIDRAAQERRVREVYQAYIDEPQTSLAAICERYDMRLQSIYKLFKRYGLKPARYTYGYSKSRQGHV